MRSDDPPAAVWPSRKAVDVRSVKSCFPSLLFASGFYEIRGTKTPPNVKRFWRCFRQYLVFTAVYLMEPKGMLKNYLTAFFSAKRHFCENE